MERGRRGRESEGHGSEGDGVGGGAQKTAVHPCATLTCRLPQRRPSVGVTGWRPRSMILDAGEPTWPPRTTHPALFPACWTHRPLLGLTAPFHPPHAGSRTIRTPRPGGRSAWRGSTGTCSRPDASAPSTRWTRSTGSRSIGCAGRGSRTTKRWPSTSSSGRRSPTAGPGARRDPMRRRCRPRRPMPARSSGDTSAGCATRCCTSMVSWPYGTCTSFSSCTATRSRDRRP